MKAQIFQMCKTTSRRAALATASLYSFVFAALVVMALQHGYGWWLTLLQVVAVFSILSAALAYFGSVRERKLMLLPHIVLQYVTCAVLYVGQFLTIFIVDIDDALSTMLNFLVGYNFLIGLVLAVCVCSIPLMFSATVLSCSLAVHEFYSCLKEQPSASEDIPDAKSDNVVQPLPLFTV